MQISGPPSDGNISSENRYLTHTMVVIDGKTFTAKIYKKSSDGTREQQALQDSDWKKVESYIRKEGFDQLKKNKDFVDAADKKLDDARTVKSITFDVKANKISYVTAASKIICKPMQTT